MGCKYINFIVWIQTMPLKTLWTNIYHVIIINWQPIFVKLKHMVTKRVGGRNIKPFVNLIFHGKKKNLESFPMESLTLQKGLIDVK